MVANRKFSRNRLFLYLIPITLGVGGILVSLQQDDLFIRMIVIVLSVSIPLVAGVNLLAGYKTRLSERIFLGAGIIMLILGASVSVSGFTEKSVFEGVTFFQRLDFPGLIGFSSLTLGLFVVLYSVGRTGEDIEDIGMRFQHLAEQMNEGFVLLSPDGRITMVNDQFLRMCGLPESEVLGVNASDLASQLNLAPISNHLQYRAKGIASEYEVNWRVRGEERRYWFHGKPLHDSQGRIRGSMATVRDITEQHRLAQRVEEYAHELQEQVEEQTRKLSQSETRLRQLLLSMNEGFLTIDEDNRIRFVNPRFSQMIGLSEEELVDREIYDFVHPSSRIRLVNMLARDVDAATRREVSFVDNSGAQLPTLVASAYLSDLPEREPRYSLVVTNVRELKDMQRQLEARAAELERANDELRMHDRAKDAFLSNVSHELRTPLSTIQGYIEMLRSGTLGELDDAQENALRIMNRNGQRLLGLINEIIDFSRMEIRGVQLNVNLFSPKRMAEEAVASVQPDALARNISATCFCASEALYAWGDRDKLGQVLTILLNNAVKFTEDGGRVTVSVTSSTDDSLVMTVTDTGIGIEPAFQEQVFEKFFQVDSSKSRRYEGTGIGLSIAKSIVEAHGGAIRLDSTPGKGTTFALTFPGSLMRPNLGDDVPVMAVEPARALLIDQSPALAEALAPTLEASGIHLHGVSHVNGALRAAREEVVHLVIVNTLPEDPAGEGVRRILASDPGTQHLPLVICTSEPMEKLRFLADSGNVQFVPKPFNLRSFLDCLHDSIAPDAAEQPDALRAIRAVSPNVPHVLVVDADPGMLEWMELALGRHGIACICATSLTVAQKAVENDAPSVVFVDVDLPERNVAEYLDELRMQENLREAPLFVMSGVLHEAPPGLGVAGLLQKPFRVADVLAVLPESLRTKSRTKSAALT